MARIKQFRPSRARAVNAVNRLLADAQKEGVIMRTAGQYSGRRLEVDNSVMYNFGSCSYLGLEMRPELCEGAISALCDFGTQFSYSRGYLESPLYVLLESNLGAMTGRPVVVTASTTLAHIAALPVLVHDNDVVLIDQFAHASLHTAVEMLGETPVYTVRHSRMDLVEQKLLELSNQHERVWLIIDGLYSMRGDLAPFQQLADLLARYPQLHIYIDDAHTTGWMGEHGRGGALMQLSRSTRVVVALSLNKAFACAGGALALPDEETKLRIRRCGGPLLFSGPIQPPMLGAAVASSQLHLTEMHRQLQSDLMARIDYAIEIAGKRGIPLVADHRTPIFFIPRDSVRDTLSAVKNFWLSGFYVAPSLFPAVPVNSPGIRFTISLHNQFEDIEALLKAAGDALCLGRESKSVRGFEGSTPDDETNARLMNDWGRQAEYVH